MSRRRLIIGFVSIVDDYAVWHEISGHSPKTIKWYRWVLTTFEQWLIRNGRSTQLTAISIADARAFLKAEAERTDLYGGTSLRLTTQKPLSDRTLHGYARAIRAFFAWCNEEEYLSSNPMERLKLSTTDIYMEMADAQLREQHKKFSPRMQFRH